MELRKDWIAYRMRTYLQIFRGQESRKATVSGNIW